MGRPRAISFPRTGLVLLVVALLVAFAFGVFVSLASGLSRAYRAANEEPVDALRYRTVVPDTTR